MPRRTQWGAGNLIWDKGRGMTLRFLAGVTVAILSMASAVQAGPISTCYINEGYAVSATVDMDEANEVFSVKRKTSPDQTITCPMPEQDADLVIGKEAYGQTYEDLLDNHLVFTVSTGPVGDLVVVDLRDGSEVLNVSGNYEYTSMNELYYWERGEEGTAQTCDQYEELTAAGLGTDILHEKLFNLDTGETTDTGATSCEGVS